ncbi:MAG: FoF1 ATP synthase subunit a [Patescibacteria group bacterium]
MGEGLHISLAPYHLGNLWGLPITSTLLTSWLVVAFLLIGAYFVGKSLRLVPGKGQVAVEGVMGLALNYMEETLEDKALAQKYFPLIMTIFLFILCGNLVGLLPFVGPIGIHNAEGGLTPLFYPVNTDFNVPLALAIIAFIAIEFAGITVLGALKYFHKFVNFKSVIGFIVGIIELISEIARLLTFSFRLFGNIFAGKVLILLALAFLPYIVPVPLLVYEVFVGIIQAIIFALLTLFFIKIAVTEAAEH